MCEKCKSEEAIGVEYLYEGEECVGYRRLCEGCFDKEAHERYLSEISEAIQKGRVTSSGIEAEIVKGGYVNKLTYTFEVEWPSADRG